MSGIINPVVTLREDQVDLFNTQLAAYPHG
jgi:hypothetical protein